MSEPINIGELVAKAIFEVMADDSNPDRIDSAFCGIDFEDVPIHHQGIYHRAAAKVLGIVLRELNAGPPALEVVVRDPSKDEIAHSLKPLDIPHPSAPGECGKLVEDMACCRPAGHDGECDCIPF